MSARVCSLSRGFSSPGFFFSLGLWCWYNESWQYTRLDYRYTLWPVLPMVD